MMTEMNLQGRVALVTGAGLGIADSNFTTISAFSGSSTPMVNSLGLSAGSAPIKVPFTADSGGHISVYTKG